MNFMGIPIIESPHAYTMEPARKHKHGHKRIQKKWNKRYGFVKVPAVFFVSDYFGNKKLLIAPGQAAMVKLAFEHEQKPLGLFK